jgi:hypothetical protein
MGDAFNAFTGLPLGACDHTEYHELARALLAVDELEHALPPALTVWNVDDPPRQNICNLTDRDDQRLAARLRIGPAEWAGLNEDQRIGRMQAALSPCEPPTGAGGGEWLTLAAVARGLGWVVSKGKGKGRRPDSQRVNRLGLDDNGEHGHARRISKRSVLEYCHAEGLEWNEAAAAG